MTPPRADLPGEPNTACADDAARKHGSAGPAARARSKHTSRDSGGLRTLGATALGSSDGYGSVGGVPGSTQTGGGGPRQLVADGSGGSQAGPKIEPPDGAGEPSPTQALPDPILGTPRVAVLRAFASAPRGSRRGWGSPPAPQGFRRLGPPGLGRSRRTRPRRASGPAGAQPRCCIICKGRAVPQRGGPLARQVGGCKMTAARKPANSAGWRRLPPAARPHPTRGGRRAPAAPRKLFPALRAGMGPHHCGAWRGPSGGTPTLSDDQRSCRGKRLRMEAHAAAAAGTHLEKARRP